MGQGPAYTPSVPPPQPPPQPALVSVSRGGNEEGQTQRPQHQDSESGPGLIRPSVSGKEEHPAGPMGSGRAASPGGWPAQRHCPPCAGHRAARCTLRALHMGGTSYKKLGHTCQKSQVTARPCHPRVQRVDEPEPRSRALGWHPGSPCHRQRWAPLPQHTLASGMALCGAVLGALRRWAAHRAFSRLPQTCPGGAPGWRTALSILQISAQTMSRVVGPNPVSGSTLSAGSSWDSPSPSAPTHPLPLVHVGTHSLSNK